MKKNSYSGIIILLLIQASIASDCRVEQAHVTLGDKFSTSSSPSSDYFTVSAIIRGQNCNPTLKIKKFIGQIITLPPTEVRPYKSGNYSATSYFFSIPEKLTSNLNTWQIITKSDSSKVYLMPAQGAMSPPGEANIAVFADMDISAVSFPLLERMTLWNENTFDFILHVGDFAYNIQDNDGKKGDEFFEEMSKRATAKIPYVVTPGNHDLADYGKFFNFRFKMPGGGEYENRGTNYYSFRYKGVHYVTVNSDWVFLDKPDSKLVALNWLQNDLKLASENPEVNFIVFFTHRPFYCPIFVTDHCKIFYHWRPFEMVLRRYKVELYITAHAHAIFRLKKMQDFVMYEGKEAEDMPLMVVAGSSGALRMTPTNKWAMTDYEFWGESAFLRLKTNKFRIVGEFVKSKDGQVLDSFEVENRRRSVSKKKRLMVKTENMKLE